MLRDHRSVLRADFRREYGLDLERAIDEMRPFEVASLARHLSPHCATRVAIDPDAAWTPEMMLLAQQIDELRWLQWMQVGKGKKPDPYPRPGFRPDVEVIGAGEGFESFEDYDAWYAQIRAGFKPAT